MAGEIDFDWDANNVEHMKRHGVRVSEAEQAIENGSAEIDYHVIDGEERFVAIGLTNGGRFLTIPYIVQSRKVRVITAWDSTKHEQAIYWKDKGA